MNIYIYLYIYMYMLYIYIYICVSVWGHDHHGSYVQRFRSGLAFKAHKLCVSLNFRLQSNKEEEEVTITMAGWSTAKVPPPTSLSTRDTYVTRRFNRGNTNIYLGLTVETQDTTRHVPYSAFPIWSPQD